MLVIYLVLVTLLVAVSGITIWLREDTTEEEIFWTQLLYWQTILLMVLAIALAIVILLA